MENFAIFVSVIENEAHTRPRDVFDRRAERKDRPFNGFGLVGRVTLSPDLSSSCQYTLKHPRKM